MLASRPADLSNSRYSPPAYCTPRSLWCNSPLLCGGVGDRHRQLPAGQAGVSVVPVRDIHAAATANLANLADYGITQAKLSAFKKKVDAFEASLGKPRVPSWTSVPLARSTRPHPHLCRLRRKISTPHPNPLPPSPSSIRWARVEAGQWWGERSREREHVDSRKHRPTVLHTFIHSFPCRS